MVGDDLFDKLSTSTVLGGSPEMVGNDLFDKPNVSTVLRDPLRDNIHDTGFFFWAHRRHLQWTLNSAAATTTTTNTTTTTTACNRSCSSSIYSYFYLCHTLLFTSDKVDP